MRLKSNCNKNCITPCSRPLKELDCRSVILPPAPAQGYVKAWAPAGTEVITSGALFPQAVRRQRLLVAVGAIILMGLALTAGCRRQDAGARDNPRSVAAVPVSVAVVEQKTVPVQLRTFGTVESYATVGIKSQVVGELMTIHFQEGQDVKRGDPLFTIDPRPFEAALQMAQANLARDTAQSKNAQSEAARAEKLFREGVLTQEELDRRRTAADALTAAVQADAAAVDQAQLQLEYCFIHAPMDGRTGSRHADVGELVKIGGDSPLVTINQIKPIYVAFSPPQQELGRIRKYLAQEQKLAVEAIIPAGGGPPNRGLLTLVENQIDLATGTIRLKGTFANEDERLWPGQHVEVVLTLTRQSDAIVAPAQAVQTRQAGQFVFVVKDDNTVEDRPVTMDRTINNESVISEGLQPGEKVVTDGHLRLVPGAPVELKDALPVREVKEP